MRKSRKKAGNKIHVLRSLAAASMHSLLVFGLCAYSPFVSTATAAQETTKAGTATTTTTTVSTTPAATPGASTSPAPTLGEVLALRTVAKADRLKKLDRTKLHRIDWRVTGSGCAACLGRIRKRIDKLNGVFEVAVAIKPPYGVAVIYDASKTSMDEILKTGIKDETVKVEFINPEDIKIDGPPMLLIPKYNNLGKSDGTTTSTSSTGTASTAAH